MIRNAPCSPPESKVAVIVPCHRVRKHILDVLDGLPDWIDLIVVVDDQCPERTGSYVEAQSTDPRVEVVFCQHNLGVGGAVMVGYRHAIARGVDILVKMDGDGQMDPVLLYPLIAPIVRGDADYTKGNRFYDLTHIGRMPRIRIFGNAILSLFSKFSTGYWDIFDPTNGYTALRARAARRLPFDRISSRYFFESDILFRLNTIRARVMDIPMPPRYGDEVSGLRVRKIVPEFLWRHLRNGCKRIFYNYFLRDASLATLELVAGVAFVCVGASAGALYWMQSFRTGVATTAGEVMLAALPIIVGIQLLLGFLSYDIANVPKTRLHDHLTEADLEAEGQP